MNVRLRGARQSDIPVLRELSEESIDFNALLKKRRTVGVVAEIQKEIVGYIVYTIEKNNLVIVDLFVVDYMRRCGIGKDLVSQLIINLGIKQKTIDLVVTERNLDSHLFFNALGFQALGVSKDYFEKGHSGYNFSYNSKDPFGVKFVRRKSKKIDESCKGR